jgi:putative methyltransferase (TIGR04325 family)
MWVAAQNQGKLHVLDFGGSLGSSYFQNRQFLSNLTEVTWSVVEQPHFVESGREFIQDDCLQFYLTIDECLERRSPNVIVLSSVLQYLENPHIMLEKLRNIDASVIIIDRIIVNKTRRNFLYNQIVPPSIYSASYPCWSLSEDVLIKSLSVSYHLVSDFPSLNFPALKEIESIFKGFIFVRKIS